MGAMAKMRNSTPVILWVLIFSFGVLWVLQDTQVFDVVAGGPTTMGSVNGSTISIEEYNDRVSFYIDQYNQQSAVPMTNDIRANIEEQAWDDLVAERLVDQKIDELGITVTDDEVVNMITGNNPAPFIRQQFQDEEGVIDRIALQAAIEAPENQEIWIMIEDQLRQNRKQEKMFNLINSSMAVSNRDVELAWQRENSFADIRYIRIPYSEVADEELVVNDSDIESYYRNNRDRFHRNESWRFQYVTFDKTPTSEDTARTVQDLEQLRDRFAEAEDHQQFLSQNQSQTQFSDNYIAPDELRDEYRPVLDLEVGEVSEVHMINGDPHLFKKLDEQDGEIKFAVFSYQVEADPVATIDRQAEEADDFSFYASEDGFQQEADAQGREVFSASATRGVPFVPGLGEASPLIGQLERMRRGEISDVIELNNQFIVVQVTDVIPEGPRPLEEVRGQIENTLKNQMRRELAVDRAREVAGGDGSLEELASASDLEIHNAGNIRMGGNTFTGAGREPGIIGAIFGLDEGERSGILEGNSAAFIVEVESMTIADPSDMNQQEREQYRLGLEQQKGSVFNSVWLEQLKEDANIRDNRGALLSR